MFRTSQCYDFRNGMIIQSTSVQAALAAKTRLATRDRSDHLVCPACRKRTTLYALSDGRKKCGVCGKKFQPNKKTDDLRVRQCADVLLCFTLDFSAEQAAKITGYRARLVSVLYASFRSLLAAQNLVPGKIRLLLETERQNRTPNESAFCARCRGRFRCRGRTSGDAAVFGVKILEGGTLFIDPLSDDEACSRFAVFDDAARGAHGRFSGYAGFICRGKFHRFEDNERTRDGAERMWAWIHERLQRHHGIWRKNTGHYLKELEWKYNNRALAPEEQALAIAGLLPDDFLSTWPTKSA